MKSVAEFKQRVRIATGALYGAEMQLEFSYCSLPEAKQAFARIHIAQKALRLIKREIFDEMNEIRGYYDARRYILAQKVKHHPIPFGLELKRLIAELHSLEAKMNHAIKPYEDISVTIDNALTRLDEQEIKAKQWIKEEKVAGRPVERRWRFWKR